MKKIKLILLTMLLAGFIPLKAETWSVYFSGESKGISSGTTVYAYAWDNVSGDELLGVSPGTAMTVYNSDKLVWTIDIEIPTDAEPMISFKIEDSWSGNQTTSNFSLQNGGFYDWNGLIENIVYDGICYSINDDLSTMSVVSNPYENYSGDIVIPESVNHSGTEYEVTNINADAFKNCKNLVSVEIPASITSIGSKAFNGCSSLTSVVWNPVNVANFTSLSNAPFYNCSSIESFKFGESVEHIPAYLCYGLSKLTATTIPASVATIGIYAFNGTALTSVEIPASVTSIGDCAFQNCNSLTNVVWNPVNVADFTESTYAPFCDYGNSESNISSFVFGETVEHIPAYLCCGLSKLTEVTIPETVTSIGQYAFGYSGITSIEIPASVTSIGSTAFGNCSSLISVIWNSVNCADFTYYSAPFSSSIELFKFGESVEHIPAYLCYGLSKLTEITIPASVTSIGSTAFGNCSSLISVIWNSVNCADFTNSPFYNCSSIESFKFSESVEYIPAYLCYGLSKLTEVTIPSAVTSISQYTFYGTGLTSIEIPASVTSIGNSAFQNCSSLTSIEIPASLISLGGSVFKNCSSLANVVWNPVNFTDFTSSSNAPFYNCSSIESFKFGESVEYIPAYLCYGLSKLTEVTIPSAVTSISQYTFYGTGLTSIEIPTAVTSIGQYAFYGASLTSVEIPASVTSIGDYAFQNCNSMASVVWNAINCADFSNPPFSYDNYDTYVSSVTSFVFGETVEHIPAYLCYGLGKLTATTIPASVATVGSYAFNGTALTSVEIPASVTSIDDYAFQNCNSLTSVVWNAINCTDFSYPPFSYEDYNTYTYVSNITSFVFGETVEHIPAFLCLGMDKLTEITIPEKVSSVGMYAFSDCSSLTKVVWNPVNIADFTDSSYAPFYNMYRYGECNISSFVFGEAVEHIPAYLCYNMGNLTEVAIPASVLSIGKYAFDSTALTSVEIPASVTSIGSSAFGGCSSLTNVVWNPVNFTDFTSPSKALFYNCSSIESFKFGETVEHIPAYLCYGLSKLTEVAIPASVLSIGKYSFYSAGLTSVEIPASVTSIGDYAFSGTALASVEIPASVTSIGKYAFEYCNSLTSVVWNAINCADFSNPPFSYEDYDTYMYVSNITSFVFGETVEHIPAYLCYGLSNLTEVAIPASVTSIGDYAFSGTALTSVEIPASITSIGGYVFQNCNSLTSVIWNSVNCADFTYYSAPFSSSIELFKFGESVEHIPAYLCYGLSKLTEITIPASVATVGSSAFSCTALTSVEIPASVTTVGSYAFSDTALTSVVIGESVSSIGDYAFMGCSGLTSIVCNPTVPPVVSENVFSDYSAKLTVPKESYDSYLNDAVWSLFLAGNSLGDVNGDEEINITDVVGLTNHILGVTSSTFVEANADVNGDSEINITDVVALTNIILGITTANEMPAETDEYTTSEIVLSGNSVDANGVQTFDVVLHNDKPFTAFQTDLSLPEGMELIDVVLSDRAAKSHFINFSEIGNGTYRIVSSSMKNESYSDQSGELFSIVVKHTGMSQDGILSLNDNLFVTPLAIGYELEDVALEISGTTSVESLPTATKIYGQGNNIVILSPMDCVSVISGVDGIVKTVETKAGRNEYPVETGGMYIIRSGEKIVKVIIK